MSNYQKNRKAGTVMTSAGFAQRQVPLTRVLLGNRTPIVFTIDYEEKGRYAIIDASDLQPSHLGSAQNPYHFIPEAQPRNRATSASGALTPERIAKNLRPQELLTGLTAYSGPPVVNQRGEVIQGNGRAYALKLYYSQFPGDERGYKAAIDAGNPVFGFLLLEESLAAQGITRPVVVRMLEVSDREAIELGQFTQSDTEAVATSVTKVKTKARLLTKPVLRRIINNLTGGRDNDDSTLAELIRSSKILSVLVKDEIIRADDLENYTRNGVINETGVTFVSSLLLNALFRTADVNTSDVLTQLPMMVQNAVAKSTIYLLACQGAKDLNDEVAGGVLAYREFLRSGIGSMRAWSNQLDISGQTPQNRYPETERAIADLFARSVTQKEIVAKFRQYSILVNSQAATMFDAARPGLTKRDAIRQVFDADYRPDGAVLTKARRANSVIAGARPGSAKRRTQAKPTVDLTAVPTPPRDRSQANATKAAGRRYAAVNKSLIRQGTTAQRSGAARQKAPVSQPTAPAMKTQLTPLQQQYNSVKQSYPNAILLFQVGETFESFNDDAVVVSKTLRLPLADNSSAKADGFDKVVTFGYDQLLGYMPKLTKAGYRVAICNKKTAPQPSPAVRRAVTELIDAQDFTAPLDSPTPAPTKTDNKMVKKSKESTVKKSDQTKKTVNKTTKTAKKKGEIVEKKDDEPVKSKRAKPVSLAKVRSASTTKRNALVAQDKTAGQKAARAGRKVGTVAVKSGSELKGSAYIKEKDRLADEIHLNSATGRTITVKEYAISRSEASRRAFALLSKVKKAKNVTNVRIRVK